MADSAEVFEAISHPVRIKILKILEKQPSSFASLKRQLSLDSSGNLDHHLKKLGPLITTREDGLYTLSDAGKEALISIEAIETWKDDERRKKGTLIRAPRMISLLAFLEIVIAAASTIINVQIVTAVLFLNVPGYPHVFFFSWLSLLNIHTLITALALASAAGLLTRKSWAWTLAIIGAVVLLLDGLPPVLRESVLILSRNLYWNIETLWLVLFPAGALTLFLALQPSLRESIGTKYKTPVPRRALIGGALGILSGIVNIPVAEILAHSPGGGTVGLSGVMNIAGMLIVIGGVLILLRNYLLGALLLIITSSVTIYNYFIIGTAISRIFPCH